MNPAPKNGQSATDSPSDLPHDSNLQPAERFSSAKRKRKKEKKNMLLFAVILIIILVVLLGFEQILTSSEIQEGKVPKGTYQINP